MPILISLFSISLIIISILFSRKLILVRNGNFLENIREDGAPLLEELRDITLKKIKKYGYLTLVTSIRLYFRTINTTKAKYKEIKDKLKNVDKSKLINEIEKREVNKFLKVVSTYKHKIRQIKHQIKEEENVL